MIKFGVIINLLGLIIFDYSYRVQIQTVTSPQIQTSIRNAISLNLQLLANSIFTLQIVVQLFSALQVFNDPWKTLNFITTIACWSTIFLDYVYYDESLFYEVIMLVRIAKSVRIIEIFQSLKNPFEAFISTVPSLNKVFFPLFIFVLFYAVTGMILFGGGTEYRCRATPNPLINATSWPEVDERLCGSNLLHCPVGYCGDPFDYGLPLNLTEQDLESNQYGLVNFDNLLSATLSVYHYAFLSNWTQMKDKFSRFINPYVTAFYFVTCAIFLFFITANLIMISLSKAYGEKQKQKNSTLKEQEVEIENENLVEYEDLISNNKWQKILYYMDIFFIIIQSVILVLQYEGITEVQEMLLSTSDFGLTWIALSIISLRLLIQGKDVLKNNLNLIDWITILISLGDFFYCIGIGQNMISPNSDFSRFLRSIKFVRIIKVLFISKDLLIYEKKLFKLFFMTLKSMINFLLLLFSISVVFSFTGAQIFAYRVRFDKQNIVNIENGEPYVFNFENIFKSIINIVALYENESWAETMYNYYHATGVKAIFFFTIVIFIAHLMLTRLFIAMFLIYFRCKLEDADEHSEHEELFGQKQSKVLLSIEHKSEGSNIQQKYFDEYHQNYKNTININEEIYLDDKIFWCINRQFFLVRIARMISNSYFLHILIILVTTAYGFSIFIRTSSDSIAKQNTLFQLEQFPIYLYVFELLIGILGNGLYFGRNSYLKKSLLNVLNLVICIFGIVSEISLLDKLISNILRRFLVLKIFIIFKDSGKEMSIIIESISSISKKFIRMYGVYMFVLLIACLAPLKIQKNYFYTCYNSYYSEENVPTNSIDCMNAGGDWVKQIQSFKNILSSLLLMYQIVSSESWTYFIQISIPNQPWDFYFVAIYFFYNVCLLSIFIGVSVQTYLEFKNKAYKLNLLKSNQKAWILIKNCINELVPQPSLQQPVNRSFPIKTAFRIINYRRYQDIIDLLAFLNLILFTLRIYRSSQSYQSALDFLDIFFLTIFILDTFLKIIALRSSFFYLNNSKIDTCGLCFYIFYGVLLLVTNLSNQVIRINEAILAFFQILRCKKVLFRFSWSRTLINSILQVLPKCLSIGKLLFTVLFVYVAIGLQLFKYVKPSPSIDGYTTGFNNFFTGMSTLLKIASNQSWFNQVSALIRSSTPIDVCFKIANANDALKYGGMGCGYYIAYPFLISFHVLMSLLILNLLIATMVSAYDQNYEKQYNSVNIFQLQKCLSLWQKYDPKGLGVIPFKKFWRLSSEIGILFGISKKKLIKSKQKFLEQLNIGIYYSIDPTQTPVLCYKFHDVITRFSMIKLQVSVDKTDQNVNAIDFDIDPYIEQEISDYISKVPTQLYKKVRPYANYTSCQMKYFFSLLRKMRAWRKAAKFKDSNTISKLTQIIKIAMERKKQQEEIMDLIAKNRKTVHFSSLSESLNRLVQSNNSNK